MVDVHKINNPRPYVEIDLPKCFEVPGCRTEYFDIYNFFISIFICIYRGFFQWGGKRGV